MQPSVRSGVRAAALLCALSFAAAAHAATSGDYRTRNSGNWTDTTVWQKYNGSVWNNVTTSPTSADGEITIRDSVAVSAPLTVDQVTVNAGKQITILFGQTLTLADGTGTDLTVDGTVLNQGTMAFTGSATWAVNDGGTYIHNTVSAVAASLDVATLGAASTFIYRGSGTLDSPSSLGGRTYGNLRYESTSGSWSFNPTTAQPITILGDFFLGTGVTMTAANTGVMTFGGNFTIDGTLTNGSGTQKYTFTGPAATVSGAAAIVLEQVTVASGANVSLGSSATVATGFAATIDAGGQLTIPSGNTLTLSSGAGTSLVIDGTLLNSGTVTVGASATCAVNDGGNYIHNTTTSIAAFLDAATLTTGSTVTYRGSNSVTPVPATSNRTYGNLAFDGSGYSATLSGAGDLIVNGDFTVSGSPNLTITQTGTLRFAGNFTGGGIINNGAGTQKYEFTGVGKTIGGPAPLQFERFKIPTGADVTCAANVFFLSGFADTIDGTLGIDVPGIFTTDATVRVNGTVRIKFDVPNGGAGALSYAPGATLSIEDFTTLHSTGVWWPSANGPANVTVTSAGILDMGSVSRTVSGTFRTAGGVSSLGGGTLTLPGVTQIDAGGSFNLAPTYTSGSTLIYNRSMTMGPEWGSGSVAGVGVPQNVSIQPGSGAVSLPGSNRTCPGILTLTSGSLATGTKKVILGATGSVVRTAGQVNGNLQKTVPVGAPSVIFEIGDGVLYAPVQVDFASVTVAGPLTASTTAGDHPDLASSPLDGTQSVNRWWSLGNGGAAFTTCNAKFTFDPADLDAGASTSRFMVGNYNAPTWVLPTVGSRLATSTQATGLTAFGDFAVAESLQYTITATAGAHGSIAPSGAIAVAKGASQSFTISPAVNYHIADVLVDGASVGAVPAYTFTGVTANHTISASFAITTYTITASAGTGGSISPSGSVTVNSGANQTFTIAPAAGYGILSLLVDGADVGAVSSYTFSGVTADHTIAASFSGGPGFAFRSAASGDWCAPSTWEMFDGTSWVPATLVPDSTNSTITIRSPDVVSMTCSPLADELTVDSGAQLTIGSGQTFTLANGVGVDLTINGTLLNSGTLSVNSGATCAVNGGGNYIHKTTSSVNAFLDAATLATGSTVTYRGSNSVTPVPATSNRTYGNLAFDGSGYSTTLSGAGDLTVNGDFTVSGSPFITITQTGTLRFAGNFTCGGFISNGSGTQKYEFTGVGKTIGGPAVLQFERFKIPTGADVTCSANVIFLSGFADTVDGTLGIGVPGPFTTDATVRINGTVRIKSDVPNGGSGAFSYAPGATLSIESFIFPRSSYVWWPSANGPANVTVTSAGSLDMSSVSRTVSGTFKTAGAVFGTASTLTLPGIAQIDAGGSFGIPPIYTSNSTLVYNRSMTIGPEWGSGSVAGVGVPQNVTIQPGSGAVSLPGSDRTCPGLLTLTNGRLATGANTLILTDPGNIAAPSAPGVPHAVFRTGGWVDGRLQKPVVAGIPSQVFEIGDATRYAPVQVDFIGISADGTLTASTTTGDHPSIASSPLNPAKTANRVWTLTNAGTVFDSAAMTVTFDSLDVDAEADPAAFLVGRFTAPSTWTAPAVGARTATSTQATGLTAFGDFAVGEAPAPVAVGDPWLVSAAIPAATALLPASPNPARGVAHLRFALHERGPVRLAVYDIRGRLVRTLLRAEAIAGTHGLVWDTRDASGHAVGAGLYLLRLEAGGRAVTGRLQIVR